MSWILPLLLGAILSSEVGAAGDSIHGTLPAELLMPVHLGGSLGREKRQAIDKTQPLRVLPVYASSVDASLQDKASLVRNTIIPKLLDFLRQSLSVAPLPGPILLNNRCTTPFFFRNATTGRTMCGSECAPTTTCGQFSVPQEHLKQCVQCNAQGTSVNPNDCVPGTPAQDGAGVEGYDFILYITANQSACPDAGAGAQTLAFAIPCQTEASQDRPVAGTINFCPLGVQNRSPDFAFAVTKHEILHALGFSSFLFALWRDPATNMPRTQRQSNGVPAVSNGAFVVDVNTIDTTTYSAWQTQAGTVSHQVTRLVTPRIREEARNHFNCSTLAGVELENQGGSGTALQHWEKRVLGNEAMTGQVTFNPVFSRITFAALEDSGWYRVNYSLADELVWGRGAGCRFVEGSCREWIDQQTSQGQPPAPFCEVLESTSPLSLSCTADHEAVSRCNRINGFSGIPSDFQYFSDSGSGGRITLTDFCPIQDVFSFSTSSGEITRNTTCFFAANAPPDNALLERYGPNSRCVTHGRQWTRNGQPISVYGGGCYEYSCGVDQVSITIAGQVFVCSCSNAGTEVIVDLVIGSVRHQGSIVCPSCTAICHVQSINFIQDTSSSVTVPITSLPPTVPDTSQPTSQPFGQSTGQSMGQPASETTEDTSTADATSHDSSFLLVTILGLTTFLQ